MDLFIPTGGKTNNWYARIYIPQDLIGHYGKAVEFKKSLRTRDKLLALCRAADYFKEISQDFLNKRAELAEQERRLETLPTPEKTVLDKNLITKISMLRLGDLVGMDDDIRNGEQEWDDYEDFVAERLKLVKSVVSRRRQSPDWDTFSEECLDAADSYGYAVSLTDPSFDEFILAMAKAEKRAYDLMTARNEGESAEITDEEVGIVLSRVVVDWWNEPNWLEDEKTRKTYLSRISNFVEFVKDKPITAVERSDIYAWYKKLLFEQGLSNVTVRDGYSPALKSLFNFAVNTGQYGMRENPAMDVAFPKLTKQQQLERSRPRYSFPTSYMNAFFASWWYAGKNVRGGKSSDVFIAGGARYWLPLMAMVQGLRPEEICQMTLLDVGPQSGVFSLNITDEGEEQQLKNQHSKRWVPVHPVLLQLGFVNYVSLERKRQGVPEPEDVFQARQPGQLPQGYPKAGALFPELHTHYQRKANAIGKLFNEFIHNKLKFENVYVLYSFRHTWEDRLRDAQAKDGAWPPGLAFQLSGRSRMNNSAGKQVSREEEEGSSIHYGNGYTPAAMLPYLSQLDYSDVTLPVAWADFIQR